MGVRACIRVHVIVASATCCISALTVRTSTNMTRGELRLLYMRSCRRSATDTGSGMKIPSEHLVLGVFGTIGAAAYASMRGGSSKKEEKTPASVPLNAENAYVIMYVLTSDSEEEAFIKQFLAEAMKEEKN